MYRTRILRGAAVFGLTATLCTTNLWAQRGGTPAGAGQPATATPGQSGQQGAPNNQSNSQGGNSRPTNQPQNAASPQAPQGTANPNGTNPNGTNPNGTNPIQGTPNGTTLPSNIPLSPGVTNGISSNPGSGNLTNGSNIGSPNGLPFTFGSSNLPNAFGGGFGLPGNGILNTSMGQYNPSTGQFSPNGPGGATQGTAATQQGTMNQNNSNLGQFNPNMGQAFPGAAQGAGVSPLATMGANQMQGQPNGAGGFPNGGFFPNGPTNAPFGFGSGVAIIPVGSGESQSGQQPVQQTAHHMSATLPSASPSFSPVAILQIQLPENADLYVQGQKVLQSGRDRVVMTTPLSGTMQVEVRAVWHKDGHDLVAIQPVTLSPGDQKELTIISGTRAK